MGISPKGGCGLQEKDCPVNGGLVLVCKPLTQKGRFLTGAVLFGQRDFVRWSRLKACRLRSGF